jgi:ferredoxin-NADP reductase
MATPQKLRCRVNNIVSHGERVYTLDLIPHSPPIPRFKPGQFFHLALDPYDPAGFWPESRVFSIASSPRDRNRIQFTYSIRGRYTARMEEELATGREVWTKMPYGLFFVDPNRPAVLLAGGTGITAFTSFLHDLTGSPHCPVTVVYGARDHRLLVYRSLVDRCTQDLTGFQSLYFLESLEQTLPNAVAGRISIAPVWQRVPDPLNSNFYLSGPPEMLNTLSTQLQDSGVKSHCIHMDAWE